MRRVLLFAFFALALPTAALASSTDPIGIDFSVVPNAGSPGFTGSNLQHATAVNLGHETYMVNGVGPGDQSGLSVGNSVSLSPQTITFGHGDTASIDFTKSWTADGNHFTETFTSVTLNRDSGRNSLGLDLSGTLSGEGITEPITAILSFNQAGGGHHRVNWAMTEEASTGGVIPEPGTLGMLGTGLIGLAGPARRKLKI